MDPNNPNPPPPPPAPPPVPPPPPPPPPPPAPDEGFGPDIIKALENRPQPQQQPESDGLGPEIVKALEGLAKLVDLTALQNDLLRATNYLLSANPNDQSGTNPQVGPAYRGGNSANDLDRVMSKYFGQESKEVDPQKGIGRYAGIKLGRAWKGSKSRRWGKATTKTVTGAARTLGIGKKTSKGIGNVAGVAGKVAGAFVSIVETVLKARNAIDGWTEGVFAGTARLAEFSGGMATVMANREIAQIRRDVERGAATSGTASSLQKAEEARKIEENKVGIAIDNATNNILTILNNLITPLVSGLNAVVEGMKELPGVGDAIKKFLEGTPGPSGTFYPLDTSAADRVKEMDARGESLMDIARRASTRVGLGGTAGPSGAAGRGRLP